MQAASQTASAASSSSSPASAFVASAYSSSPAPNAPVYIAGQIHSIIHAKQKANVKADEVVRLFEADKKEPFSMIDMNETWEPNGYDLLQSLIHLMHSLTREWDIYEQSARKLDAAVTPVIMRLVKDGRYDVEHRDKFGDHALHHLTRRFELSHHGWAYNLAEELLRAGIDVNAVDRFGSTALLVASQWRPADLTSATTLRMLIRHGADINAVDWQGTTAIQWMVRQENLRAVKDLLRDTGERDENSMLHADLTIQDLRGQSAVGTARYNMEATFRSYPYNRRVAILEAREMYEVLVAHWRRIQYRYPRRIQQKLMDLTPLPRVLADMVREYTTDLPLINEPEPGPSVSSSSFSSSSPSS